MVWKPAVFVAVLASLAGTGEADAAVWAWACAGPDGAAHLVFNRDQLVRVPFAVDEALLHRLMFRDDMRGDPAFAKLPAAGLTIFSPRDLNSGLVDTMVYERADKPTVTLTLTEKASKTLSKRMIPGCRDETTVRFRKTYRLETEGEPAHDVTLRCFDYTLSTRGGRSCE